MVINDTAKSNASIVRRYLAGIFPFAGWTFCPEGWVESIVKVFELLVGQTKIAN